MPEKTSKSSRTDLTKFPRFLPRRTHCLIRAAVLGQFQYPTLAILISILFLSGTLLAQAPDTGSREETADTPDSARTTNNPLFVIHPNDILEIYVWKEPDLTRKVLVRPDGRISFPLVQDMQAAGMTPGEIKQEIERELKKYIEVPNVTVIVDAIQSYRVFVTGKVGKPGAIMAEQPITVLQPLP